jgi:signal transduction histidine kinase
VSCRAKSPDEAGVPIAESGLVQMEIIVADTGCGIPYDKLHGMFIDFERADLGEPRTSSGLGAYISQDQGCLSLLILLYLAGLGLAVVARIIEQTGGVLRARSEVGQGSEFVYTISLVRHTSLMNISPTTPKHGL